MFFQLRAVFVCRHVFQYVQHGIQVCFHRVFNGKIHFHCFLISRLFPQIIFGKPKSYFRAFDCGLIIRVFAGILPQFLPVKHRKIRVRSMVHHQRLPVLVHHLAVSKPAFELFCFRLFQIFDSRTRVVYTMDEAVLHRNPGELDPGALEQVTCLFLFPVVHADFTGVSVCRKTPSWPPLPANSATLVCGKSAAAQGLGALPL